MNMNWRNNLVDENILIEFDSEAIGDTDGFKVVRILG